MKKILLVLGLCSSLAFSEVYYKNKDTKYNDRYKVRDQINVNGYITHVSEWRNYSVITIRLRNGEEIKAKVLPDDRFIENDIVIGRCVNYKRGRYERCSLRIR